jgi:hypothetical protein
LGHYAVYINKGKNNMKIANVQDVLASVPAHWALIDKQHYSFFGLRDCQDFDLVAAFKTPDGVVSVVSYEGIDEFLQEYEKQLRTIRRLTKGKNWREISPINPLMFGWQSVGEKKFYVSIFEAHNSSGGVSVQIFYQGDYVIGMHTTIEKPKQYILDALAQQHPTIGQIVDIF